MILLKICLAFRQGGHQEWVYRIRVGCEVSVWVIIDRMSIIRSAIFCYFLIIMKSTPVICGIDLGSWTFKLSVFSGDNFEILTNEANFRETPSLVGYTPT